jgi:flagella synthesis protein FlgN
MTRMTRQQAGARLVDGVGEDLAACAEICLLLERQFDAAVRHQSAHLAELAQQLTPLLDAMEARRQQRVALVRALLGQAATTRNSTLMAEQFSVMQRVLHGEEETYAPR